MTRRYLLVLLALVIMLAVHQNWNPASVVVPRPGAALNEDEAKTYLAGAHSRIFDESGRLSDILEAQRVDHFQQGNYSMITEPRYYAHSEDGKTWSLSAARGRMVHGQDRLLLRKNVVLSHDQSGARMQTHSLDLDLSTRIATSDRQVTLEQGDNRTRADSMVASLEHETLNLKSNVESIYVPPPRSP